MRRDDLRQKVFDELDLGIIYQPVSDTAALDVIGRAAALRHWLTEECGCRRSEGPCNACSTTGHAATEGVTLLVTPDGTSMLAVPLDWLGDDE